MKLWIDDIRPAPEGWVWAKNANFAMACFNFGVEEISLDHDLGENIPTGYDLLCKIEELVAAGKWNKNGWNWGVIPIFHIHSANPVGRKNMERAIESIHRLSQ
ncbi:MAG TPA: cyclic-phosphate processing receiver domain-containing protein [Candidatus Nanoarchaeia archaeon]|nr:cyclic-phosphate processing receiver domain-containing protein [Candidatus Nanoarchaeia archaeon]